MFQPPRSASSPTQVPVPSPLPTPSSHLEGYNIGDPIGAFSGYLRRPKSSSAGLLAMVFGENGEDADVIASLHLSHYQDVPVKVTVWMIKDKDGRLMSTNSDFPKLTDFVASIRRPAATTAGQTAQFFGRNGPNADAINVLNKSEYLDAFVYVEIQVADDEKEAKDIPTAKPSAELADASSRMVPAEAKELKKQQRRAQEATRVLMVSGFFRLPSVWASLGSEQDFETWLTQQKCCHPGSKPCDRRPVIAFAIPGAQPRRYNFVGLCTEHAADWEQGNSGLASPVDFLKSRQTALTQLWAQETLAKTLKIPEGFELVPQKVHAWALEKKIQVPPAYLSFL